MIDLTTDTRPEKSGIPPRKIVSGSSRQNPNKHAYRIGPEALQSCRVEPPTATKVASGVFYYGFRYYVPELGRFINRDLIGELDPKLVDSLLQRSGRENSESEKKQIEALVGAENLVYFSASGSRSEGSLNQYDIEGARFPYLFCHNDGINQQDLYGLGGPLIPAGVVLAIGIGGFLAESTVNVCICMSLDYGEEIVTQTPLTRLAQMTSAILNAIGTASCSYGTEPLWRKRIWRDSSGDCDGRYELRCF